MKFVLRITGAVGHFEVADVHGGKQKETVKWKIVNRSNDDLVNLTFAPKPGWPYPFQAGSESKIDIKSNGKPEEMEAKILSAIGPGSYKFNLVADPNATVIGADPDIEVAGDLGALRAKTKRVRQAPGKSSKLKSGKPAVKKGIKKSAKASKRKKTAKRK